MQRLKAQHFATSMFRFGSLADICAAKCNVRFTPESGHVQRTSLSRFTPNSGIRLRVEMQRVTILSVYSEPPRRSIAI